MKKYSKTLLAVIAIGLFLGSQTVKATNHWTTAASVAPIENRTDKPIRIKFAYAGGPSYFGFGGPSAPTTCQMLCPHFYDIQSHNTITLPQDKPAVTSIEFFDGEGKQSFGWTNDLSKSDMTKIVFSDGKIWAEKNGELVEAKKL